MNTNGTNLRCFGSETKDDGGLVFNFTVPFLKFCRRKGDCKSCIMEKVLKDGNNPENFLPSGTFISLDDE